MFRVASIQYVLRDRALEIYISGCLGINGEHCKNCHNPTLWDPKVGNDLEWAMEEIKTRFKVAKNMIESIRIYGGEPLEKPILELTDFLFWLKGFEKDIWLFTRFEFEKVPKPILELVDYIKCGPYLEELSEPTEYYGVTLATSNQKIYKKGKDYE